MSIVTNTQKYILELAETIRRTTRIPENVYQAFATVPRHIFIEPYFHNNNLTIPQCYADVVIRLKTTSSGFSSTSSVPSLMAQMITLAEVTKGQRVVEIGTGSGYGAALLAHIVGPKGSVITVDIDEELTSNAERGLAQLGYDKIVKVLTEDGFQTKVDKKSDRLIATVSCPIIPECWYTQPQPGYKLVIPLQLPDSGPLLVFTKQPDNTLKGTASTWVIFVDPQGVSSQYIANNQVELAQRLSKQKKQRYHMREYLSYSGFCAFRIITAINCPNAIDFILLGHFPDLALVSESGLLVIREDELAAFGQVAELMEWYNRSWDLYKQLGKPQLSNLIFTVPATKSACLTYRRGAFELGVTI